MRLQLLAVTLAATLCAGAAHAACPTLPVTITNGTPTDATQVMANFTTLASCPALVGKFVSPNYYTTGAVIIQDAPGDPNAALLQFVNNADTIEYASVRGVRGSAPSYAGGFHFNQGVGVEMDPDPTMAVDVNGTVRSNSSYLLNNAAGTSRFYAVQSAGSTRWEWGADSSSESGSNAGSNFFLQSYTDAGVALATPLAINRATSAAAFAGQATFAGNVGIGTTSPNNALSVYGASNSVLTASVLQNYVGSSAYAQFLLQTGTANDWVKWAVADNNGSPSFVLQTGSALQTVQFAGPNFSVVNPSTFTPWLSVNTSPTTSLGEVSIWSNSPPAGFPFYVNGAAAIQGALQVGTSSYTGAYALYVNGSSGGTTGWTNLSDGRLKRDVSTITDALGMVERLRGVRFRWRAAGDRAVGASLELPADETEIGLVAQEVAQVVPEAVVSPKNGSDGLYGLKEGDLVPVLVEAVKQQQAQITAQQAAIKAQQAQIDKLEALVAGRLSAANNPAALGGPGMQ